MPLIRRSLVRRASRKAPKAVLIESRNRVDQPAVNPRLRSPQPAIPLAIFVLDGHPLIRRAFLAFLQENGHCVETSASLASAALRLDQAPFDLLFCALSLPDGDGLDLLPRLKRHRPILSVAMSGFGPPANLSRSRAAGFQIHLIKPFPAEAILPILAHALRLRNELPGG